MSKKLGVIQSNYLPWKGYFDFINSVDEFVFYDDVEFSKGSWRNRNQIKGPGGLQWLTVPVEYKHSSKEEIRNIRTVDSDWRIKHWNAIESAYGKSEHFSEITEWLQPVLFENYNHNLSELNRALISRIVNFLEIETQLSTSWSHQTVPGKTQRLISLCKSVDADTYVSGPAAMNYLDVSAFASEGIKVEWFEYRDYDEYPQRWGDFVHNVSVIDLLFNCGSKSKSYI